jgi:hypothetical protein
MVPVEPQRPVHSDVRATKNERAAAPRRVDHASRVRAADARTCQPDDDDPYADVPCTD